MKKISKIEKLVKEELNNILEQTGVSRWVATIDMYVYGRDEKAAREEAEDIIKMIDEQADNHPALVSIKSQQFGQIGEEEKGENETSPIDGTSKKQAVKFILKKYDVYNKLKGFFNDQSWKPINGIIGDLQKGNIPIQIDDTKYYKHDGVPSGKIWYCSIPFINQNGRKDTIHINITAAGAGSVQDPTSRYDISFVIN